jgi:hypothetical protein
MDFSAQKQLKTGFGFHHAADLSCNLVQADRRLAMLTPVYLEQHEGLPARFPGRRVQTDLFQAPADLELMFQFRSVFRLVHRRIPPAWRVAVLSPAKVGVTISLLTPGGPVAADSHRYGFFIRPVQCD